MTMYLVLLAFTYLQLFIFCVFLYCMYASSQYINYQHKPEADVYHLISIRPGLPVPS